MEQQADFNITPLKLIRVQHLLQTESQALLTKEGRENLKFLLAPIVCNNAQQQNQFYTIFENYLKNNLKYTDEEKERLRAEQEIIDAKIKLENDIATGLNPSKNKEEIDDWSAWWPYMMAALAILLLAFKVYAYVNQPKLVEIKFHKKNNIVRVGDSLAVHKLLQSVTRIESDSAVDVSSDATIKWKWSILDKNDIVQDYSEEFVWNSVIETETSNYDRQILLTAKDKDTNLSLGEASSQITIKCANPPRPTGGIKIESKSQLKPNSLIRFSVDFPDSAKWQYKWKIKETVLGNALNLNHRFNTSGEHIIKFEIQPRNPTAGKCDTTLTKTILIEKTDTARLHLNLWDFEKDDNTYPKPQKNRWPIPLLIGLFGLSAWLWNLVIRRNRKQKEIEQKELEIEQKELESKFKSHDKSPYTIPFEKKEEDIALKNEQLVLANTMRQRQEGLRKNLDVQKTVRATVEKGGFLDLKYNTNTQPTDYVVFVDEQTTGSHQAKLFRYLAEMLREQDVLMEVFYYRNDMSRLWNAKHKTGISLDQVSRLYHHQRLVVMGDLHQIVDDADDDELFIESQVQSLIRWKERLLISPLPVSSWTYKEARLYALFPIFPADLKGLIHAARFIESGFEYEDLPNALSDWEERLQKRESEYESTVERRWSTLKRHEDYLKDHPDVLEWLKALAVFPEPNWNITIAIGEVTNAKVTFDNLLLLARIPWLQEGVFPNKLWRQILKDSQYAEIEPKAREAVVKELEKVAKETEGSFAHYQTELNLAVQRFALAPDEEKNKTVIAYLKQQGLLPKIHQEELDRTVANKFKQHDTEHNRQQTGGVLGAYLNAPIPKKDKQDRKVSRLNVLAGLTTALSLIMLTWYLLGGHQWPFMTTVQNYSKAAEYNNRAVQIMENDAEAYKTIEDSISVEKQVLERQYISKLDEVKTLLDSALIVDTTYKIAQINQQKQWLQRGALYYFAALAANDNDKNPLRVAIENFEKLNTKDSLYLHAQLGIATALHKINEQDTSATCRILKDILQTDSTFFDALKAPNVFTETKCFATPEPQKYHIRTLVLEQGSNEPIQGATITLPNRLKLISNAKGQIDTTFERKLFSSNQINVSVEKENYQITNTQVSIFESISNDRNTIYLTQKPELDFDGDGVPDSKDKCPTETGNIDNDGCPPPVVIDKKPLSKETQAFNQATTKYQKSGLPRAQWILQIDSLDLSNKALTQIPTEVWECKNLKYLNLSFNQLTTLPEQVVELTQLQDLEASYNQINRLPAQIGQLNNLQRLGLAKNNLTDPLPDGMARLQNLSYLGLTDNQLSEELLDYLRETLPNCKIDPEKITQPDIIYPQMVQVKGGTFTMGCTDEQGEDCEEDESPKHQVTLSDFAIGKYEVTVEEYLAFADETKSNYPEWLEEGNDYHVETGSDDYYKSKGYTRGAKKLPIVGVSWDNVVEYCIWLSKKTGKDYRLPTEAEWEYAARGGKERKPTKFSGSENLDKVGWYGSNSDSKTHPVGQLQPNELGIYDMSGNVWEWCADWYGEYSAEAKNNPRGPENGEFRVLRGGSWINLNNSCRVSSRGSSDPVNRDISVGFRVARH